MKRIFLLLAVMLCLPFMAKAQEDIIRSAYASLDTMSTENRTAMELVLSEMEKAYQKEQVKSIAGVPFGTSKDKAMPILKNKFGLPINSLSDLNVTFRNVEYAKNIFDLIIFQFQSDGRDTYLRGCIFTNYAKTYMEALDIEKRYANMLAKKYEMINRLPDENGNPKHMCGYSPLWNGVLKDIKDYYFGAIHTDITDVPEDLEKLSGAKYLVQIVYGYFDYVKDEF